MEPARFILMKDVQGYKLDGPVIATLKRAIGDEPRSSVNVLRGELVEEVKSDVDYNLKVCNDPTIMLRCYDEDVAPLYSPEEFPLMEGISTPGERFEAFQEGQVELGLKIRVDSLVYVAVSGPNLAEKKYARAVIRFKGKVGNLPGTTFGVEIMETNCPLGTSDGTFQEERYFNCKDDYGLFVPLNKLSQHRPDGGGSYMRQKLRSHERPSSPRLAMGTDTPAQNTRSKSMFTESSVDVFAYQIGERVSFHDKRGILFKGVVRWTGTETRIKKFDYVVIGIQTDDEIFKSDFENSVIGMDHLIKPVQMNHALFLPESLIDKIPVEAESNPSMLEESLASNLAKEMHVSRDELMSEQSQALVEAEINKKSLEEEKEKQVAIEMMRLAGENTNELSQQQKEYRKFQNESRPGMVGRGVQGQPPEKQCDFCLISTPPKGSPVREHRKMHQQDDHHVERSSRRSFSFSDDHEHAHLTANGREQRRPGLGILGRSSSAINQEGDRRPSGSGSSFVRASSTAENGQPSGSGAISGNQGGFTQGSAVAASTGEGPPLDIGVGHLIEVPCSSEGGRARRGVIKWIGSLPKTEGVLAGIELDEYMKGCTDGSWTDPEGRTCQFFNCSSGKGLYYPLNGLRPDSRYTSSKFSDSRNPLWDVPDNVTIEHAPSVDSDIEKYIGNRKGIQGHQNSCYLDATVFGLFALTQEFDEMFQCTAEDSSNAVGQILQEKIVNPLRTHGVVRFESVMTLREQLELLGKMSGITRDEKDPEEFLNLMFKHSLKMKPFLRIRRPFGVESEFFVQLFLETDDSSHPPDVESLLTRMFTEQQISFIQVPSKLLIQVPRFGKQFKAFPKIIPNKTLDVTRITDSLNPGKCWFCEVTNAILYCEGCSKTYCHQCFKLSHQLSKKEHKVVKFGTEVGSELELLSVICIETSHYVCFTRRGDSWLFFDSMSNRVYDKYNIPRVQDCSRELNQWVYPADNDIDQLVQTPSRELPECVRRFTQDIYMCVYIQTDNSMYL